MAGATLAEMVAVVALLGIVTLIAIPRADPVGSLAAEAVAGEIANALRFARQEAIRTGRYHVVTIDPATQALSVWRRTGSGAIGRDTGFTVLHPLERREYLISFANNGLPSTTIAGSVFNYNATAAQNYASFGPDGVPADIIGNWTNGVPSTRSLLLGDGLVTIRHGQSERQVRLDPVTGRVTY
jgi:Tfp pilus assembly protein FimT